MRDTTEMDLYCELFRTMVLVREFEDAARRFFLNGDIYGSIHLCVGQEAVSAGIVPVLEGRDWLACTYRGHGHVLARGCDPQAFMDELVGRATGLCGGRAGSMNVVDISHHLIGCFGIVGGSIGAATGVALALRGTGAVAVALFGDGAANQAYFHESLNLAKVKRLPVLFVCENNGYGEFTPTEHMTPGGICERAAALDIPASLVDGQDLFAVRSAAIEAVERARSDGPIFLEVRTYRYSDHARGDPVQYRPEGELERWKLRDPIGLARARLETEMLVASEILDGIVADVRLRVAEICERALAAPFPDAATPATEYASTTS
jgi:TPP-dependent pyruvate/acetoin dehydrogenase alpha subunit